MKRNWSNGAFDFHRERTVRICKRSGCQKVFEVTPSDPKRYYSQRCSGLVNNASRTLSEETKRRIAFAMKGKVSPFKGVIKIPRVEVVCQNAACAKTFVCERWCLHKYCSNKCAMAVIGARPTSPRAARAKAGKREDLGDIYFYSRWEANFARLLNYLGVEWRYQPKTFDLNGHHYTPDFYLPLDDSYVEIKNFLAPYSRERDRKFRKLYPNIVLRLILKKEYIELEKRYAFLIPHWEYRNSKFVTDRKLSPIHHKRKLSRGTQAANESGL